MDNNVEQQINNTTAERNNVVNQISSYQSQLNLLNDQNEEYRIRRDAVKSVKDNIPCSFDPRSISRFQNRSFNGLQYGIKADGINSKQQIIDAMRERYEKDVHSDAKMSEILSLLGQEISRLNQLISQNEASIQSCNNSISNYENQKNNLDKQINHLNYVKNNWN